MNLYDLDQPIIELASNSETSYWTTRHAVEGVQIFGGIGSGKTSGSGRMLALKYLAAGFGGLVLTVKPEEKDTWQEYCRITGREDDLLIIEPGGEHRFNFLEYESIQGQGQDAITENMVEVLKTVIRASAERDSGKSDDPFWETALDMLIFNVIDLCKLAYGTVSVQQMYEIVQTIPKGKPDLEAQLLSDKSKSTAFFKALENARINVVQKIDNWDLRPVYEPLQDQVAFEERLLEAIPEARLLRYIDQFFFENFIVLSEKTRSIIDFTFSGFLFRLLREPIHSLFCRNDSTVIPEDSLDGKIILINLPVKLYHKAGRDCQILFKYIWQRAMEKRNISENSWPVFLWADEAQHFLHEHDVDYQATARSSRIATVYISQNLPNYYACMGGAKSEYRVKSFLGTLGTKIFHANADIETNQYASSLIGDAYFEDHTKGVSVGKDFSISRGESLKLQKAVRPEAFVSLKTGGPHNSYRVEGYIHRQGDMVHKGFNYTKMTFNQEYLPR